MGAIHTDTPPSYRAERLTCGRCEFCDLLPWALIGAFLACVLMGLATFLVYTATRAYKEDAQRTRDLLRIAELHCATERYKLQQRLDGSTLRHPFDNNIASNPLDQHSPRAFDPDSAATA